MLKNFFEICNNLKQLTNEPHNLEILNNLRKRCIKKRDTDVQNRLLDSVGEGEGGLFWENSMYIIYSETNHQPRLDAWDKCSGLVHWEDPEESGGEGGGRGGSGWGIHVNPWLIHVKVWQNPLQCCEVISLQLIKINEKKKNKKEKEKGVSGMYKIYVDTSLS